MVRDSNEVAIVVITTNTVVINHLSLFIASFLFFIF